jgi:hypothetical protein
MALLHSSENRALKRSTLEWHHNTLHHFVKI